MTLKGKDMENIYIPPNLARASILLLQHGKSQ